MSTPAWKPLRSHHRGQIITQIIYSPVLPVDAALATMAGSEILVVRSGLSAERRRAAIRAVREQARLRRLALVPVMAAAAMRRALHQIARLIPGAGNYGSHAATSDAASHVAGVAIALAGVSAAAVITAATVSGGLGHGSPPAARAVQPANVTMVVHRHTHYQRHLPVKTASRTSGNGQVAAPAPSASVSVPGVAGVSIQVPLVPKLKLPIQLPPSLSKLLQELSL